MASDTPRNGGSVFWSYLGPILVVICLGAGSYIINGTASDVEALDSRVDRLEEGRPEVAERLGRIEELSRATRGDVQEIKRRFLLHLPPAQMRAPE
ncbi:MAG: hypothetical protein AB7I42_22715 [Bradyrhizobium sp.]|uniref:hypothetical protein n=1 Tax=Bradyrhizobium sp. TaxID=376 RepID=UPI003D0EC983